jgi:hypothetical protein
MGLHNEGVIGPVTATNLAVGRGAYNRVEQRHDAPALVPMGEIDSFRRMLDVPAPSVARFASPLDLLERDVKDLLAAIIGEPFVPRDHGGELGDLFSTRVMFQGRPTAACFVLKGRGLRTKLTPRWIGKNGDQLTWMLAQPADLFVVQHVGEVSTAVHRQLEDAVLARRSRGHVQALGSVWDGVDLARLFVAHDFIDRRSGNLRPEIGSPASA